MANDETAPLLGGSDAAPKRAALFSPATRILFAGFIISLSFSYTQTPILYTFHVMVCEEYYRHAPAYEGPGDRCSRNEIDAGAAAQLAIMGCATIVCAILNLFITGWQMRRVGPKMALAIQTFFPVIRVSIQAASLWVGAGGGLIVMQMSQILTLMGGPAGYILVLNTIIAEITEPAARTAMFGRLQGVVMLGVALGYLVGGIVAERVSIKAPFDLAAISLALCCVYSCLFVPYVDPKSLTAGDKGPKAKGLSAFFGPLKALGSQRMRLTDGRIVRHYGIFFLALGVFTGVLATGYAPTLIQMYAMTKFGFRSTNNSLLMAVNCLIRGIFLMFVFPHIISYGRRWFKTSTGVASPEPDLDTVIPTEPRDFDPVPITVADQEPAKPPSPVERTEGAAFDLFFLRWSLLIDGVITASSAFATQGWHMYMVGFLLPLASGSAPASKGVLTEMVPASQKAEVLQAMTLVEYTATFTTLGLFGAIFSTLADAGKSYLTFYCNAAIAIVGVCLLLFSRFPPQDSELVPEQADENSPMQDEP
ncbi:Uu.00g132170.m01.CDS01 [Anthostomella pinea]|uniref:Uu.00g132170.m01.CDS01 n=1 Tax=Anthostomella pinea TaxID=933095 RepID=A0AAI8VJ21_9PEZI|nr:Uu.00g132170.m01.CDS01 [Anthostomella pinea]